MSAAREISAVAKIPARESRDKEALCRTVGSLSDSGELAAFIEGIPGFLVDDISGADIMKHILRDKNLNLGPRIVEKLHISVYRDPSEAVRGTISCLGAIWHIIVYCYRKDTPRNDIEEWFNEETLPVLETLFYEGPIIGHYLLSTTAAFTSSILSSYMFSAKSMEQELRHLGVELPWAVSEPRLEQKRVENYLFNTSPDVTSGCIMALKKWLSMLYRDFTAIKAHMDGQQPPSTDELIQSLWAFQTLVNEAQITVYNDFLTKLLSDFPPYEALVTFYRLDCDHDPSLSVSLYNQTRLVDFLRAYDDMSSVAFEQLLGDVVILDNDDLINETIDIVADYLNDNPDNEAALRASSTLIEQKDRQRPSARGNLWITQAK
ncbi:hypothetical protein C0992_013125 [Termitomyces sp. T32_za158]|nr:hypothetical protein C0992_013125 [Termitomyces sp. T32_za158]